MMLKNTIGITGLTSILSLTNCSLDIAHNQATQASSISETYEQYNEEEQRERNYNLIRENAIENFLLGYVRHISPRSGNFKKNVIKREGNNLEEKIRNFTIDYSEGHVILLDAVRDGIYHDGEISKGDIKNISIDLAAKMARDKGNVDYSDSKFLKQLEIWAKTKMSYFEKLLESSSQDKEGEEGFKELVNNAYTFDELKDYIDKQNKANTKLYDSMQNTLRGLVYLFSDIEFTPIREETKRVYDSIIEWRK